MNKLTKQHEGEAVVYTHPDGGSVSAIITRVEGNVIQLRFAVPYNNHRVAILSPAHWHRLTLFGNAKFLCV